MATPLLSREEMQATIDYAVTRTPLDGADAKLIGFARHWVSDRLVDREAIDPARWLDAWLEEPGHYDRLDDQEQAIWIVDFWRTFAAAIGEA